jgi:hypothetical protein
MAHSAIDRYLGREEAHQLIQRAAKSSEEIAV